MRILGYQRHWAKLDQPEHTTFRFSRADADRGLDWAVGETVIEVVQPRASHASGQREIIGPATIIAKEPRYLFEITEAEAIADGFHYGIEPMLEWLGATHAGHENFWLNKEPINKLTLQRLGQVNR